MMLFLGYCVFGGGGEELLWGGEGVSEERGVRSVRVSR